VKMVHNGIEYADMQLIAEAYLLLKHVGHFDNAQLAEIFSEYQKGELNSFLIHITSDIFREQDDKSGKELVDCIRDAAQQKGTGRWTSIEALKQGVDVSMIAAAGNTRVMSNNENRKAAEKQYPHVEIAEISNPDAFKEEVRQGLYAAKIIAYAQGFDLLKQASASYGWELPLGKIASIFRAGCIIQAKFLNDITRAYEQQADLSHLLLDSFFQERVVSYEKNLRQIGAQAILSGIPVPAMANAISYLDLFCATHVGANLIQAQRDYFGAHTFERVDEEGSFHHEWRRWA
jgi:6-phosphogluconate dehydrogenase